MDNTHQEKPPVENLMDLWAETISECWGAMLDMRFLNPALKWEEKTNGNSRGAYMGWKPCLKIWQVFAQSMTDPNTIASFPKAFVDFPETLKKMQQSELDRYSQMQTQWMQKMDSMEKITRLMVMRMYS